MKTRYVWTVVGMAFATTLAVVVGQRLSSEAMAVIIGVVAGVAASIPTSLIVVWAASRSLSRRVVEAPPAVVETLRAEPPRMIVVQQPAPLAAPQGYFLPQSAPAYGAAWPAVTQPRRYTVVGGAQVELEGESLEAGQEVIWQ